MGIRNSEALVQSEFRTDGAGHPTGGFTSMWVDGNSESEGLAAIQIHWQDGIIGPKGQNGAFIEDVIEAALQRLRWFNSRPESRCRENSLAITKLEEAMQWLDWRTRQRVIGGVENTYESHEPAESVA